MRFIRRYFPEAMQMFDNRPLNVINGGKGYMSVSNGVLKFLDVKNYLPPGTSPKMFLAHSNTELMKGLFPYEYLCDIKVLSDTQLPPPEKWYSKLKGCNELGKTQEEITQNFQAMQDVWEKNNMQTMADILKWYNNLDVIPMIEAVEKLAQQYKAKGIDCFKQAISSPGTALITGMKASEMAGYKLVNEKNKDFHYKITQNIVGGPSIVFSQLNISGETSIRDTSNIYQNILGYDANSLNLNI